MKGQVVGDDSRKRYGAATGGGDPSEHLTQLVSRRAASYGVVASDEAPGERGELKQNDADVDVRRPSRHTLMVEMAVNVDATLRDDSKGDMRQQQGRVAVHVQGCFGPRRSHRRPPSRPR